MNRFFLPLLTMGLLLFSACADTGDPEVLDEADIILDDDLGAMDNDLGDGLYNTWDADRDARLTTTEFNTGFDSDNWWDTWDTDRDTYLSEDEFNTAYGNYSWYTPTLYGEYDVNRDGLLDENEWRTGLFNTWDTDRDTYLSADEYDRNDGLFDM